jgi:coenzyme F420-0:L-glutamate ligase/coenzyme F420-1:gamma-L-glutamate ligase
MKTGSYAPDRVEMIALRGLPMVGKGMDLAELIAAGLEAASLELQDDDILVVAQKIVSKAEGRMVRLADVAPSEEARRRGQETGKDPAVVQLILDESLSVLRQGAQVLIVDHRLGFVMANAGIDQSNAAPGCAILLPVDPDASAARLADALGRRCGRRIGVIIIDSFGRAWRNGTVGTAIGVSGLPALLDLRGTPDLFGRPLQITEVGLADELAAAASLLMGQADEGTPVVVLRGLRLPERDGSAADLHRARELDLFR